VPDSDLLQKSAATGFFPMIAIAMEIPAKISLLACGFLPDLYCDKNSCKEITGMQIYS
jgi:hypothetical protein